MDQSTIRLRRFFSPTRRRPRRGFSPAGRPLEGRRLLSAPSAVMTQTATFPDLESYPTASSQAILYFSATIGTLTEVDLVTSGSFQSQFSAENLTQSGSTIQGTTSGHLSINVPSGAVPVTIPSVTETFNAAPFDGRIDYGGSSGKDFVPITSSSTPQTTVLTSPADLAAFTGSFRMPISVSGHATGSASSTSGELSAGFKTQTSATITVIYHYIPNLPSLDPPPPQPANVGRAVHQQNGRPPGAGSLLATPSTQPKQHGSSKVGTTTHKGVLHASGRHWRLASAGEQHGITKARLIHQD